MADVQVKELLSSDILFNVGNLATVQEEILKNNAEDYSKPTKQVAFVNPNYGPKKIEKKAEQEVAKQDETVAESTQDSSEKTKPEQKLFENIPVFGLIVGAGLVLVLILSIFWFKK